METLVSTLQLFSHVYFGVHFRLHDNIDCRVVGGRGIMEMIGARCWFVR